MERSSGSIWGKLGNGKQMKTVKDVKMINFSGFDENGLLVPMQNFPFDVKRAFTVSGVDSTAPRGKHAHRETQQVLVCLNGSIVCLCKDQSGAEVSITLEDPRVGLLVPEMIWDEQIYNSGDSILLSLCSTEYNRDDYIENWEDFVNENC